jgi:hypothetical protein
VIVMHLIGGRGLPGVSWKFRDIQSQRYAPDYFDAPLPGMTAEESPYLERYVLLGKRDDGVHLYMYVGREEAKSPLP